VRAIILLTLAVAVSFASAGLEGRLRGTLVAGERGAAVFAGEDGRQRLFWVGDEIGGAVVFAVEPGRVMVTERGESRWLYLPEAAVSAEAESSGPRGASRRPGYASALDRPETAGAAEALDNTGKKLSQEAVAGLLGVSLPESSGFDPVEYLARAAASGIVPEKGLYELANSVLRTMKVKAYDQGGQSGVQLDLVMPGSTPAGLGFVGGDVIVAIDGHQVRSLRDAIRLYPVLSGRSEVTVDYLRGGRRESRIVRLR